MKTKAPRFLLFIFLIFMFLGCSKHMLPSSQNVVKSPWPNYNKAKVAYEQIIQGETTIEDLKSLGVDPYNAPNIEILSFSDVLSTYLSNRSIKKNDLDEGIIKCIDAKNGCTGYRLLPGTINNKRKGSVILDTLKFKRVTHKTGWRFKGLILVVDDIVIYKERPSGKPKIDELETKKQPLGPLQNTGDIAISTGKKLL